MHRRSLERSSAHRRGSGSAVPASKKDVDYCPVESTYWTEPRVGLIKETLEAVLSVVELEKDGKVVDVDGFRLKRLSDWLVPSTGPDDVLKYLANYCNVSCAFCFLRGDPPTFRVRRRVSDEELECRLKYYDPQRKLSLFPTTLQHYEVLAHPRALEIMERLREKTTEEFSITTNGKTLTEEMVKRLAGLKPVSVNISLNCAVPEVRRILMKDDTPEIAINSLPLLKKYSIPYSVSVVMWPDIVTFEALRRTALYAAEHGAMVILVHVPGYTKYFPGKISFDTAEYWDAVIREVQEIKEVVDVPIYVDPHILEMNKYEDDPTVARVLGVWKDSPAARAGLRNGDHIVKIQDCEIDLASDAHTLLLRLEKEGLDAIDVEYVRAGQLQKVRLNGRPYGIVVRDGLRVSSVVRAIDIIKKHNAKRALLLSSAPMRRSVEAILEKYELFEEIGDAEVRIEIPTSEFFGGNILVGDLMINTDFIEAIRRVKATGWMPDLVLIPWSTFSRWKSDLVGRCYLEIQRETGVRVELIPCQTIL